MSSQDNSGVGGANSDKNVAQIAVQKTVTPVVQATAQQATATFRTIGAGQSSQVRVVMPPGATLMPQAMIKQIENNAAGVRTQITAIPGRSISQTSITVTRPVTPTTYMPRAGGPATSLQSQRLSTPIRTPTPPTVTGLSGNFVRGTTVARNSSSPATTVISPTTGTWMAAGTGQVQLIRAINHQSRQRIVAQNITPSSTGNTGVVTVGQANLTSGQSQQQQNQGNIQSVTSQQAYVATLATVIPPRQQTATLVYSNVSNSQAPQFNPTGGATQRFTVAASLAGSQRQMRPIQLSNRTFSAAKLGVGGMNTTSISIRAPNIPVLTPTLNTGNATGTIQARNTTGNVNLSTTSLSTTRIIQLQQQQPGTGAQQIIGSTGRITSNLMLQPIIMNATAGGKIGIRPPTTIATKVQPSLTITQLGLGKLSAAQQQSTNASTLTATNIQGATITPSPTNTSNIVASVTGSIVQQQQQSQQQQSNISQQQTVSVNATQIVSVNQNIGGSASGQILSAQNVNVPASATVVPLAITSRGTNVLTGTITPIKNATALSVPPIAKVLPQQQHQQQIQQQQQQQHQQQQQQHHHQSQNTQIQSNQGNQQQQQVTEIITSTPQSHHQQQASLFIHTRPQSSGNAGNTTAVIPSSGTFLPAGGTFYYESVPTSVPLSTGVLSLTTTTVTSSVSNSQTVTSSNLGTGIVSSIPYTPSQGTFTVVPSNSRTIGQIQIPVSSSNTTTQNINQIQAVPLRFNPQHITEQSINVTGQGSVNVQSQQPQQQHHQIITMTQTSQSQQQQQQHQHQQQQQQQHQQHQQQQQQQSTQQAQQTHMLIPVQASIKLPVTAMAAASPPRPAGITSIGTVNTAFLRKRDNSGSPLRVAKNLAPTLLQMANNSNQQLPTVPIERNNKEKERPNTPQSRPGSSGGSTTVSANSSPGVDQQMSEEINSMQPMNVRVSNESHFNPINDMYPNHQNTSTPSSLRTQQSQLQQHTTATSNGSVEVATKKKSRRPTLKNDRNESGQNQQIQQQPPSLPQQPNAQQVHSSSQQNNQTQQQQQLASNNNHEGLAKANNNNNTIISNNKENTKPTEVILKKPRIFSLLDGYKLNWKAANNHFQRYSDVKPREERRPTVMDLANQAHVVQKINGWKIYHLSAQMEDLCEIETQEYEKLATMLKQLEGHGQSSDIDRVNDLIKGNMQRSKIIVDGVNEARTQIMKIFDHKSHVSDIIHRCASKRNFKKREK